MSAVRRAFVAVLALVALPACGEQRAPAANASPRLAPVPVAADSVTVSGISSGGYMAVQFHVAHSALVRGAGIFAAGPYDCARNSIANGLGPCMKGDTPIPTAELVAATRQRALAGAVDPIDGLAGDRVFIFHGDADTVVAEPVVDALQGYYAALVPAAAILRVDLPAAGHVLPTANPATGPCEVTKSPFLGNCGFDGPRRMLEHLYGDLAATAATPGELRAVDQAPYVAATGAEGLAPQGWLYVPAACSGSGAPGRCRLHVAFHGCKQGASYVQDEFVRRSGYLAAADAGNVVVLFPQVEPSFRPLNPNGCWDWWGYGGEDYATRRGPQVRAIRAMVDDLLGAATAPPEE